MSNSVDQPVKILWLRRKETDNTSFSALVPSFNSIFDYMALLLILMIFSRSSIVEVLIPRLSSITFLGVYFILILSFFLLFLRGEKAEFFVPGILVLSVVALSCLLSPMRGQAIRKGIGWLFLFGLLGPLLSVPSFVKYRACAWSCCRFLVLASGVSSIAWYFLRLPTIGTGGAFTGVMSHCMLAGPFCAMACLFAVIQAVRRNSYKWGFLALLCVVPTLAAGSRSALLSLTAGLFVIFLTVKKLRILLILFFPLALYYFVTHPGKDIIVDDQTVLGEMTSKLRTKGMLNTREALWQSRISEFKEFPFFGMGVGMGRGAGSVEKKGKINIEPGSSYLAILSMTGSVGALAFVILFFALASRFFHYTPDIPFLERLEVLSILTLLAVHAAAEGWILAVGSILAVVFWLSVGRLFDCWSPSSKR